MRGAIWRFETWRGVDSMPGMLLMGTPGMYGQWWSKLLSLWQLSRLVHMSCMWRRKQTSFYTSVRIKTWTRLDPPTPQMHPGLANTDNDSVTQRTHDIIMTSLWRRNDVATSFWRLNDVIIASCACWAWRLHDAIKTSLWRQNDVATSFWRYNDVAIAPCVCWDIHYALIIMEICGLMPWLFRIVLYII